VQPNKTLAILPRFAYANASNIPEAGLNLIGSNYSQLSNSLKQKS